LGPEHKITKMLCLVFFSELTFWSVDFLEVDHFS
jgi:hypothetical protein